MTTDQVKKILAKESLSDRDIELLNDYEPNTGKNALYSFFTPKWLCEVVYKLAIKNGFDEDKGKVLEPSAGTGKFLSVIKHPKNVTAFELDQVNYEISKRLYPDVNIYNDYFETAFLEKPKMRTRMKNPFTWLEQHPFDLVITNPPFGTNWNNIYKALFMKPKFQKLEAHFMYLSGLQLKKGGLLAYVTASSFIRKDYKKDKEHLAKLFDFVDAYRLPDNIFKKTKVPTDIIIFKRK